MKTLNFNMHENGLWLLSSTQKLLVYSISNICEVSVNKQFISVHDLQCVKTDIQFLCSMQEILDLQFFFSVCVQILGLPSGYTVSFQYVRNPYAQPRRVTELRKEKVRNDDSYMYHTVSTEYKLL